MAGRQVNRPRSLTFQLLVWIGSFIIVTGVAACGLSFVFAYQEASELQDGQLKEIAALIDRHAMMLPGSGTAVVSSPNDDVRVVIDRLGDGMTGMLRATGLNFPAKISDGLHDMESGGQRWRVNIQTLGSGERIAVAEPSALRDEIARDGAMRTLFPTLLLLPTLFIVIVVIVRKKLAPLTRLSGAVDRQTEASLDTLSEEGIALEVLPFVRSINRLIERLRIAITHQRRFVASAAHELRSPLAALSLQAENLGSAISTTDASARLKAFQSGLRRTHRLVEQLLELARSEQAAPREMQTVSLRALATDAVNSVLPMARERDVDLGFERFDDAMVMLDEAAVAVILRNLVDNAVRYVPVGGKVDISVSCLETEVMFEVLDSGMGIPQAELERVLEPFYRLDHSASVGSGLGLSIVSEVARRTGGRLVLENVEGGFRARYFHPFKQNGGARAQVGPERR
ncbi:two-component system OmpR family sensor kinase [Paraburkholderia youngii]|uniref:sensor histidine kinase n=1 Tax=Paraburkholderia youngii TaxID=2782701 RepID=UPI003D24998B